MTGINGKLSFNSQNKNNIILVDEYDDINKILKISNNKNTKIISLDFESHKKLSKKGIEHQISDIYTTNHDLQFVQELAYSLSQWAERKEVAEIINFVGINLGKLFKVELLDYLVGFIKKFYEIIKISNKYSNCKFIASHEIFEIISLLGNSVEKINDLPTNYIHLTDNVKYYYKIGNKSLTIKLSTRNYKVLKNLSDKFIKTTFRFNLKQQSSQENILLIEFDPIKYKQLFKKAKDHGYNLLLFNRRRPTIWNLESLSVLKNSNCKIITSDLLLNTESTKSIKKNEKIIQEKIILLSQNDDFFNKLFKIHTLSFWKIIKPTFFKLLQKRFVEAVTEIEITKKLLDTFNIKSILAFSESGFNEQILINLANQKKIHVVLLQHGLVYDTPQSHYRHNFLGMYPILSDYIIVWGKTTEQFVASAGIPHKKIKALGSPMYDELFSKNIPKKNYQTILLATSPPMKDLVNDLTIKNNENYRNTIEKICNIVSSSNNKLVIKLHPSLVDFDIENMIKKIDQKIKIVQTESILPLIKHCDILIAFKNSTAHLEGQILKKPIISIMLEDYGYGESIIFRENLLTRTSISDFKTELFKILNDDNYRQRIIDNGKNLVEKYLVNKGNASEKILEFLYQISQN